jgi:hypothetical protein
MHEHDIDRIAAVAENRLEGQGLIAAQAEIDACEECRQRLAEQRLALSFLKEAPDVSMTAIERARLHRALRPAPKRSRWMKLAPAFAAAAAIVVVAASAILPRGGAATMTTLKTQSDLTGGGLERSSPEMANDSGAPAPEAVESTITTAAAATTLAGSELTVYSSAREFAAEADRLRTTPPEEPAAQCAEVAHEAMDEDPITAGEIDYNGVPAVMYVYEETAFIFATATCDFLEEIPADTP